MSTSPLPAPLESRAEVPTDSPARYAKQLASHLGRKVPAEPTDTGYRLTLGEAACELINRPDEGLLVLEATAPDAAALARVEDVVGRHLVRFGTRAELVVEWSTGNRQVLEEDPA